jgi:GDP-4-dehydro-6-deoxy-D-mannose reductase
VRAFVIGADGFAGRWLVRHLTASGDEISAIVGPNFQPSSGLADQVDPVGQVDIRDAGSVTALVKARAPDVVYNLAGISRQGDREDASEAVGVSVIGSVNVLLGCSRLSPAPRLVFVSTGYVYRAGSEPVDEEYPLGPDSMYAAAKLAAERALLTIAPAVGVDVIVARPFNHIGPGQSEGFLVPTLARQVAAAASDAGGNVIRVADPSVVRDFTDVRDVVAGYRIMAARGVAGAVYNVASGSGVSVADLARTMASVAGVDVRLEDTGVAPRPNDPRVLIGHARRLESLGWHRDYSLRATLEDVIRPYLSPAGSVR